MSKEIYISSTPHETRLAIVENDELTEIYYERENEYTLAGSIYNGKVTRVLPGMQSSFVDIGLERDAFLYITDFMEEAADTADFDHGEKPQQRAPRLEAQNGRVDRSTGSDRGDRNGSGDRNGNDRGGNDRNAESDRTTSYVSERNQEQARATPQSDVAQASEGRTEEFGGRGDRGGRSRGRGRRDRGANSDRSGTDRTASTSRQPQGEPTPHFAEEAFPTQDEIEVAPMVAADLSAPEAEIGEAAPGADGSRRWRGRRGRRRGRGAASREAVPQAGAEGTPGLEAQQQASLPNAEIDEFDEEPVFEIDGSAAETAPAAFTPVAEARPEPVQPRNESGGRGERNSRGSRTDRPQRNDRQSGSDRNAPRAPRGFAPSRSLYGVDAEPEAAETFHSAPPVEPLILPGESLGKYRKGGEDTAPRPQAAAGFATPVALPDSAFKVDPNWDGGAMLPGETLSRYRGGVPAATQGRGGDRAELRRPDGRRDPRNESRNDTRRDGRPNQPPADRTEPHGGSSLAAEPAPSPMVVPSSVPTHDLQSAGPVSGYAHTDEHTEEIQAHRPDFTHTELPQATAEAHAFEQAVHPAFEQIEAPRTIEDPQAEPAGPVEYEPEEASASYRVDPTPPSEYRQSAPPAEPETEADEAAHEAIVPEHHQAAEPLTLETVYAGTAAIELEPEAVHHEHSFEPIQTHDVTHHDVTHLDSLGTMISEPELPAAALNMEPAVQVEEPPQPFNDHADDLDTPPQGFAPGTGDLEEDFIDEEEFENPTLHAHSAEDLDDLEEEPLEGAADLGTMIRDMSLDHLTGTGSRVAEEEDDFEEDTLEEDLAPYADSDSDSDSEDELHEEASFEGFSSAREHDTEQDVEDARTKIGLDPGSESASPDGSASRAGGDPERNARRDGRRGGRDRERGRSDRGSSDRGSDRSGSNGSNGSSDRSGYDRGGLGERARNTGGGGDRERGRSGGRGRQSMQMTNLPAISELLKPGQEILCQIAKEPIAKKGARITSHIALPGRFLVFMPTVSHTGVSRKIESDAERRRLKEILLSEKGEAAGGFIVRTAAGGASEDELRSDLRFLLNLWTDIKNRSESSKSPALIYHDLNLVERILRDQVTDNFSAIWVDTETEYERVLRFLQRFQPALIRRVKLYTKEVPLFEQFGITEEINKALRSKVWLKSGGSIVINQTEALVAIDINTGKYVGKTARLEDTIVKTNLDAIPEIVRQIRLRDLGGIIIIDFIDMDERKNRNRVMAALEEELKNDRAPSKVLPFNDFGLVAITRKRVKQSLERTLSTPCNVCVGTGMVKSPVTVCNDIYVEMRKMHKHLDRGDVMLRVHPEVVKQLKLTGSRWLQEMEEMCGKTILIKSDPALHPEQFDIH